MGWTGVGRLYRHYDGHSSSSNDGRDSDVNDEENVFVPEILFRRYTQTDSRPPTPTQMLTTADTGNAAATTAAIICAGGKKHAMAVRAVTAATTPVIPTRRCVTPDPAVVGTAEKTRLILDLRKSYSQDSLNLVSS